MSIKKYYKNYKKEPNRNFETGKYNNKKEKLMGGVQHQI